MIFTIIIPYRPARRLQNENLCHMHQDYNGYWHFNSLSDTIHEIIKNEDILLRGIRSLRKNSKFHHKIVICTEPDIHFDDSYKKHLIDMYDVEFFVSSEYCDSVQTYNERQYKNISNTIREAILSRSDDEIVCYDYISDLVCGKNWDSYVVEAYNQYGDSKVYVPMFVEPKVKIGFCHAQLCGASHKDFSLTEDTTSDNIWNTWRQGCCHCLSMKYPIDRDYAIEKDLDDWSAVCNQFNQNTIIERCGERNYGYYATLIARNSIFKRASAYLKSPGAPDLEFDNNLNTEKIVVTRSHVFHLHYRCELDNIEVKHE